jgi:hypothetical protein
MYYLYLCLCTRAKCMSVELKQFETVYLFIWSHDFRISMSLSLSPNSLYHQTTNCTEGGGLTREHCSTVRDIAWLITAIRNPLRRGVLDTILCDKDYLWLVAGRWFLQGIMVSFTNKTDHDITEILWNVALNNITQSYIYTLHIIRMFADLTCHRRWFFKRPLSLESIILWWYITDYGIIKMKIIAERYEAFFSKPWKWEGGGGYPAPNICDFIDKNSNNIPASM